MSAMHRFVIWKFTADRIAEKPFGGWGFNASRWLPGGDVNLSANPASVEPALPLHPHNMALQWWVELGLPGALLGAAVVALALGAVRRLRDANSAGGGVALAAAAATIASLGFGAWQSWWIAALALTAAFYAVVARSGSAHT
jgi:O-antigen ligase